MSEQEKANSFCSRGWWMRHSTIALCRLLMAVCFVSFWFSAQVAAGQYKHNPEQVEGPDACGECHEATIEIWRATHHATSFRELPRGQEARDIATRLGIQRIKTSAQCSSCHFTAVIKAEKPKAVAAVACESCHGAARDWIDIHSDFGGEDVEAADEDPQHKMIRYQKSEAAGMIRPSNTAALIRNCLGCHMIDDENLVDTGGHPVASAFEIVRWSQGEVRHNVWYSDANEEASVERKRLLYVVGQLVNYEFSLRALSVATAKGNYAKSVAKRAKIAELRMKKLLELLSVKEIHEAYTLATETKLKLNNSEQLMATASRVAVLANELSQNYDGSELSVIDSLLPPAEKYKGDVYH